MKIGDEIYYLSGPIESAEETLVPKLGTLLHWGQEMSLTMMDNFFVPIFMLVALVCDQESGRVITVPAERVMTRESAYLANRETVQPEEEYEDNLEVRYDG